MAKLISAAERIAKARKLIETARQHPIPDELGRLDIFYIAQIKDFMRQARDLVKLIPMRAGVTAEMKAEVKQVLAEIDQAEREILHKSA